MMTLEDIEVFRALNMMGILRLPKFFQSFNSEDMQSLTQIRFKVRELMEKANSMRVATRSSFIFKSILRNMENVESFHGAGTKAFPYYLKTKWGGGKFFNAKDLFRNREYPNYIEKRYCFSNCYYFAKGIGETNEQSCKVLSGIAFVNKIAILHSIIEMPNGWIIDFNYDLAMEKELYFSLFGFETLTELTSQEIFVKDRLLSKYEKYILSYGHGYKVFALDSLLEYAENRANESQGVRLAIGNF